MTPKMTIQELIKTDEVRETFQEILGENPTSFLLGVVSIVESNADLKKCEPESVLTAASVIGRLKLELHPSFGMAFIVGYKDTKRHNKWVAQFQIGWKGLVQLCHRTGLYLDLNPSDVYEGEFQEIDRLTGKIKFSWNKDNDARELLPLIGTTAYFKLTNGFEKTSWMTVAQLERHAKKYSTEYRSTGKGRWATEKLEMMLKTNMKLLLDKWGPKSTTTRDLQMAIKMDQAVIDDFTGENGTYIDNEKADALSLDDINAKSERQRIIDAIGRAKTLAKLEELRPHINDEEMGRIFVDRQDEISPSPKK